MRCPPLFLPALLAIWTGASPAARAEEKVDYNRDIRPILANNCLLCHGPDEKERKGGLRLDTAEGALAEKDGFAAIVPGNPEESELILRITSDDAEEQMPPRKTGKTLSPREVGLLTTWVKQGASYAKHWAYVAPKRPEPPEVRDRSWPRNAIDRFLLARLEGEGLRPSPEADRLALIRRASLDLTGLPPTPAEVEAFANDPAPDAYEKLVDRLLDKPAFGEHWARMWLDLARYADSAGYADDPSRTIWAYRDYVIRSFNANKPFDRFTIEQLAGDLLPGPTEDQLIATAFQRNTMTNSEGGTNDEEFRNVAVVDRVNTAATLWMGTSMACCQCHTHKYDPLSQREYFQFFAFWNNTEDADRRDEAPLLSLYSEEQEAKKARWVEEIARLESTLRTPTPELAESQARWEKEFPPDLPWHTPSPGAMTSRNGSELAGLDDHSLLVRKGAGTDVYTVELPLEPGTLTALRLEALPHESLPNRGPGRAGNGNFVVTRVTASVVPPEAKPIAGRYVRVELPGKEKILSLAEVQVFQGTENVAPRGVASQSSTDFDGKPQLALDGKTDGDYAKAKSTTHTAISDDPWWEVDLKETRSIDRIALWNRTDNDLQARLSHFRVIVLDEGRKAVWEKAVEEAPRPSAELAVSGARPIAFAAAYADAEQPGFEAGHVIDNKDPAKKGWAIGDASGRAHELTLVPKAPIEVPEGAKLVVSLEQASGNAEHTLGRFRLGVTSHPRAADVARTPEAIRAILHSPSAERTADQAAKLAEYYRGIAPELAPARERLAEVRRQQSEMKPYTTVPILRELAEKQRRTTRLQFRGNYLDLGEETPEGVPSALPPLPDDAPRNRLTLARWLVGPENPLTGRVIANRFWEQVFGIGIVRTSEEFGTQGELPSHPELLDWLATELVQQGWDVKKFLKMLVTSAAYRQSSRVTPELFERDPDNRLLARGPRFRISAEAVRDQALFVGGLLREKMYGPPVNPPQPASGLSAAFGSSIDWKTSQGDDRYRRALYTEWRRSNPYPSMTTFDAPNRDVCTVRRNRTNTPLQALVTLNDPVYVEAAQALARRMISGASSPEDRVRLGFRACLVRPPSDPELGRLLHLYEEARAEYARDPAKAKSMAGGPAGMDAAELASWTVVANVLLNLDEMVLKR
jgi:hypothetical protein